MCLYKQSSEALIWYQILRVNICGFSAAMVTRIPNLKEDTNPTNIDDLINEEEFLSFKEQILKTYNNVSNDKKLYQGCWKSISIN